MPLHQEPDRTGIRVTSAMVSLVANTAALALSVLAATARTAIIRKIHIFNHGAVTTEVQFGTGTAPFVQGDLPGFFVVSGMDRIITEEEILGAEFIADITVQATVAGAAPANVQVSIEAEVFQGT